MLPDPKDIKLLWFISLMIVEEETWLITNVIKRSYSEHDFELDFIEFKKNLGLRERPNYAM